MKRDGNVRPIRMCGTLMTEMNLDNHLRKEPEAH